MNWYTQVFDLLFANLDKEAAHKVWRKQLTETPSNKKRGGKKHDDDDDD